MKIGIRHGWLAGLCILCIAAVQAQEPHGIVAGLDYYVPQPITMPEMIPFVQWNQSVKPPNWEKMLNEKVGRERAWEQSVLLSSWNGSPGQQVKVQSKAMEWNFRIGNSNASWSISADRLDARTLHFPVPRHMAPNRPTGSRVAPNGQIKR